MGETDDLHASLAALEATAHHEDDEAAARAIDAIGELGSPQALQALMRIYSSVAGWHEAMTRSHIVWTLYENWYLDDQDFTAAAPLLIDALRRDLRAGLGGWREVLWMLRRIGRGSRPIADAVVELILDDPNEGPEQERRELIDKRYSAARTLKDIDPAAIDASDELSRAVRSLTAQWYDLFDPDNASRLCRICGFRNDIPFDPGDICPCCGGETGVDDVRAVDIAAHRAGWIDRGAAWFRADQQPQDWDLHEQLNRVQSSQS